MGQYGENIAKKYYQELGYEIIAQNYHSRYGEIDLLCKKEGLILIVEVKTRQGNRYGYGEEIINNQKIKGLIHTYQIFAAIHNLPNYFDIEICVIELKNQEKTIKRFLL
ncbi:YraN family protein [Candidatus Parcubacteria bacterium]|nr:MAG: YraN family protein [Candidatus Parcubacteria bacterium]